MEVMDEMDDDDIHDQIKDGDGWHEILYYYKDKVLQQKFWEVLKFKPT